MHDMTPFLYIGIFFFILAIAFTVACYRDSMNPDRIAEEEWNRWRNSELARLKKIFDAKRNYLVFGYGNREEAMKEVPGELYGVYNLIYWTTFSERFRAYSKYRPDFDEKEYVKEVQKKRKGHYFCDY